MPLLYTAWALGRVTPTRATGPKKLVTQAGFGPGGQILYGEFKISSPNRKKTLLVVHTRLTDFNFTLRRVDISATISFAISVAFLDRSRRSLGAHNRRICLLRVFNPAALRPLGLPTETWELLFASRGLKLSIAGSNSAAMICSRGKLISFANARAGAGIHIFVSPLLQGLFGCTTYLIVYALAPGRNRIYRIEQDLYFFADCHSTTRTSITQCRGCSCIRLSFGTHIGQALDP
ncbi:hypothetical protein DFH05DRAFT_260016 [Lentinula detonsa]|uniref:Uncharacterized protein n=1 Tax=Lentinula detonsa TaxID=2804962 RepID=A0A9W8TVJ4_9AGAR|nr:hypothetical protein DFH05DRAFT_260016 [Lentinula detonsa]